MKTSLAKWAVAAATSGVIGCLVSGCVCSIGDGKGRTIINPTRGQELIDLKKARDEGAISEDEYQAQKRTIMQK